MENKKFMEIIEFAIDREEEAANFYRELQGMAKLDSSKIILKELENMEIGHKKVLLNFKNAGLSEYKPKIITDLKISDYMMDVVTHKEMTYQEILISAIKREENALYMYKALAAETDNEEHKNLFNMIADEEAKHKLQLESIYDQEIFVEN
jgi:rubrerythrin